MPPRVSHDDTASACRNQRKDGRWWEGATLESLSPAQWEALCDGCGRCCLVKLEDEDTGEILSTDIGCRLFDGGTCRCVDYPRRHRRVADCIALTPEEVRNLRWLPATCAYRLVADGRPLEPWHPLVSGRAESVHEAGISVRGRIAASEREVKLRDYCDHVVDWPELAPSRPL